jgi:hypothetical protein
LNSDPPVLEFKDTISATYPLWYNPAYFHEGLLVHFSLKKEISTVMRSVQVFRSASGYSLYPLLAGLLVLGCGASFRRVSTNLSRSLLLYWSVAAVGLYVLVVILPRYIAPFMVMSWFTVYDALSPGRLKAVARGAVGATAICLLLFQMLGIFKSATGVKEGVRADAQLTVARALNRFGLRAGDEIATVGSGFEAYYARLSKLHIVANIGYTGGSAAEDSMVRLNDAEINAVEAKLRQLHVRAVVSEKSHLAAPGKEWNCIENTGYCVLLTDTVAARDTTSSLGLQPTP